MTGIIVDDNEQAIKTLEGLLKHFCQQVTVVGKAQSIKDAVSLITELKPDIVFLDVEMNNETGFDLFPFFPHPDFIVIFTTSHEKYAIKAFKTDCFDYLLKPIDPVELVNCINRIEKEKSIILNLQRKQLSPEEVKQKNQLEQKQTQIIDSINYAKRIQESILTPEDEIKKHFPEIFILYMPKDIVSGDFYWFAQQNNELILVLADCTGHGVPGAFLSMVGSTLLNEIVNHNQIIDPSAIIKSLAKGLASTLINKEKEEINTDGMDISICKINLKEKTISFAGANQTIYLVNDKGLQKTDSQINSIHGIFGLAKEEIINSIDLNISPNTMVYMTTDGYIDQIGEKSRKKLLATRFEQILTEIHFLAAEEQKIRLEKKITEWKGEMNQIDDVLVIGFKI